MFKYTVLLYTLLLVTSCDYFKQEELKTPIARVNDSYLYQEDLKDLIFDDTSKEDSVLIVNNFIRRWATQQLLIDQSIINLPQNKQEDFNKLVEEYKIDLYTEAYKSAIISKQLDSVVTNEELAIYYEANKENFKLNDDLLKIRFIQVDKNYSNIKKLAKIFTRFNEEDKVTLTELKFKFKAVNLNDSVWVKKDILINTLPIIQSKSKQVLKKSNYAQLQDSLGVYLVKINDVLKPNDIAPLSYVKPTIKQIILNKRKRELLKILEKDYLIFPNHIPSQHICSRSGSGR